jgi:hypothetical protein
MATFDEIVTRVINKYKGSTGADFTTQARNAVNDAIEFYQTEQFWFTEGEATITLTVGDPEISTASGFPTDYWYLRPEGGIVIIQSQTRYPLRKAKAHEYDLFNTQGNGRPYIYRELALGIQVYYYPDQAYTMKFRYVKKYSALSSGGTNDFTAYAPQLIEARALSMLFLSQGHDGQTLHKSWENQELRFLQALREVTRQRLTNGEI